VTRDSAVEPLSDDLNSRDLVYGSLSEELIYSHKLLKTNKEDI
jgi:hypothetical protein